MASELERAISLTITDKSEAARRLGDIVKRQNEELVSAAEAKEDSLDELIKNQESAITELGKLFSENGDGDELAGLIRFSRPFLNHISKAKAAKLVRYLVDLFLDMEASTGNEIPLCKECIDWAKEERRTFLRQALEARLMTLYYETKQFQDGIQLGSSLLHELKKLDDKYLLVEVQLMESKIYHALDNLTKARAALTSARTTANSIYCPPKLQASLDMQSGILHAADERDFKTAYSYFYEAFEGYDSIDSKRKAVMSLKYMLMCKIMMNNADEVSQIISGKLALKYPNRDIEAMREISIASNKRSIAEFKKQLGIYSDELTSDPIVSTHLDTLYDTLLEQNLSRIIEPYSRVQITHIAKLIDLPLETVERKLSQMILDKKCNGILDQGEGVLRIYEETVTDQSYANALDIIREMNRAVDQLSEQARKVA